MLACAALGPTGGRHATTPLPIVPCVDLTRFAGIRHEIARPVAL